MRTKKDIPPVLTVLEVSQILRIGRISVYQAIARGDVPSLRFGRRIVIPRHSFEKMLNTASSKLDRLRGPEESA